METIIFATKNKGKIREINEILADMNVNVVSMEEAGITIDVVEAVSYTHLGRKAKAMRHSFMLTAQNL